MRTARVSIPETEGVVDADVIGTGEGLRVGGRSLPAAQARFEAACDGLVYGVVLNDEASLRALGTALHETPYKAPPSAPVLCIKPYNTHVGHGASVRLPRGADRASEIEGIGRLVDTIVGDAAFFQGVKA